MQAQTDNVSIKSYNFTSTTKEYKKRKGHKEAERLPRHNNNNNNNNKKRKKKEKRDRDYKITHFFLPVLGSMLALEAERVIGAEDAPPAAAPADRDFDDDGGK